MADLLMPFIELRTFMEEKRIPQCIAVKVCPLHIEGLKRQILHGGYLRTYTQEAAMLAAGIMGFDIVQVHDRGGCILCLAML